MKMNRENTPSLPLRERGVFSHQIFEGTQMNRDGRVMEKAGLTRIPLLLVSELVLAKLFGFFLLLPLKEIWWDNRE